MKNVLLIAVLSFFSFSSCSVFEYIFQTPPPSDDVKLQQLINHIVNHSLYNVEYSSLKLEPKTFSNEKIRVFGIILDEFQNEFIIYTDRFEDNEYGFYRIKIDNPLPKQNDIPKPFKFIACGSKINVFGIFAGLTDIKLSELESISKQQLNPNIDYSRLKKVPTIYASIIYDYDDMYFQRPIWISIELINESLQGK